MNTQMPTILIHAGGKNSRFFPINTETHKGFISLLGIPLVVRALQNLQKHGFTKIILVVSAKDMDGNGLSKILPEYNLDLDITWVLQPEAEGQGHALLVAADKVETHFISMSPYYTQAGKLAEKLWNTQQATQSECVLLGTKVDTPSLYGMLEFNQDDASQVIGIVEKPIENAPSDYKVNSIYLLSKDFLTHLSQVPQEEYSLEAALTEYTQNHAVSWIENTENLPSLKYAWHLFSMQKYLFSEISTHISSEATIAKTAIIDDSDGPVSIEKGARIGDFVKIVGPCYVGQNSLVGDYSFVRQSSIEANASVGAKTEVVRSIILEGASVHSGYVADSILGQGVKVGAGLITANKRFDRKNVQTLLKDKLVDVGSNTQGVIVGAHSHLGIGTKTMPGILIGAKNKIAPGSVVQKNVPHNEETSSVLKE
ncbi:MAG: NTP transferase domain-containing protein [Candidatus Pacebacteria bacterium]|nr:NTP transferase domain-containing protein [Candidatus Paceibacterota bacterium]PIZ78437.1 MAG: hypothetical protein COY01_04230 [Candidatus Pacebacteria bacterium CG_4_10_14_0_2_um_filter_40_20]PJA69287.1 MAG: hypothetical protein CO156_00115 [Candidatus Pacebacteria bacterium CG_4_9_14_3_um_filter_40_12]PJC41970.1 MAG: hypothetical protein CO041_01670 [Candidatus Pacebacteria bacterium CG_4_9_14_0_2_um_filter_40_15]